jgi:broad specificity phosphatase PhoE
MYFLRHGQTTFSRANAFCGSGLDPELTEDGQQMAQAFAATFQSTSWNAIYCSPLRRAVATAEPLCQALGATLELRDGLKEIGYGQWEGQSVETVSRDFHDDHLRWTADPAWNAPTGGETAVAIARRSWKLLKKLKRATIPAMCCWYHIRRQSVLRYARCLVLMWGAFVFAWVVPLAPSVWWNLRVTGRFCIRWPTARISMNVYVIFPAHEPC